MGFRLVVVVLTTEVDVEGLETELLLVGGSEIGELVGAKLLVFVEDAPPPAQVIVPVVQV